MNARKLFLLAAIASVAACSDQPTAPQLPEDPQGLDAPDGALEAGAISSNGITSDQANGSSVLAGVGSMHEKGLHISIPEFLCTYNASSGRVECPDVTVEGLVFSRSWAFYRADGTPQPRRDSLTTRVNNRTAVRGTVTRDTITLTLDRSSDFTRDGVQRGSDRHTLNGNETGRSEVVVRGAAATYRSIVVHGDTTQNLVVPLQDATGASKWPLSGTIIRVYNGTRSRDGGESKSFSRREVITFDGTPIVRIVITVNGVTRNCTRNLAEPRKEPNCS